MVCEILSDHSVKDNSEINIHMGAQFGYIGQLNSLVLNFNQYWFKFSETNKQMLPSNLLNPFALGGEGEVSETARGGGEWRGGV